MNVNALIHLLIGPLPTEDTPLEPQYNYSHMMWRDERRFRAADTNGDMVADRQEFTAFLHPEDHEHMKDIVVQVSSEVLQLLLLLLLLSSAFSTGNHRGHRQERRRPHRPAGVHR